MTAKPTDLLSSRPPWLHTVIGDHGALTDYLWAIPGHAPSDLSKDVVVRLVRGDKMLSYRQLFDEFAAALQFPYYFGMNLNALDECLRDLEWVRGRVVTLAISDAVRTLSLEEEDALINFLQLLNDVAAEWNEGVAPVEPESRPPTPFHVLLHAASADAQGLQEQVVAAGLVAPVTTLGSR
jgi:RNAse (barnase) inhibitor barstar